MADERADLIPLFGWHLFLYFLLLSLPFLNSKFNFCFWFSCSIDSTLLGSALFYSPKLFLLSISHIFNNIIKTVTRKVIIPYRTKLWWEKVWQIWWILPNRQTLFAKPFAIYLLLSVFRETLFHQIDICQTFLSPNICPICDWLSKNPPC